MVQVLDRMKTGNTPGPSHASLNIIVAIRKVAVLVMADMSENPRWIWNTS